MKRPHSANYALSFGSRLRSFLLMLSLIIGAATAVATAACVRGIIDVNKLQYEAMGGDLIMLKGEGGKRSDWETLEALLEKDARAANWTEAESCYTDEGSSPTFRSQALPPEAGNTLLIFSDQKYGSVTRNTLATGRELTETDLQSRARVCVIGESLRRLFFEAMDPIGQRLRINNMSFEIVGVYKGKYGGRIGTSDQIIVLPRTFRTLVHPESEKEYVVRCSGYKDIHAFMNDISGIMEQQLRSYGSFSASTGEGWMKHASYKNTALIGFGISAVFFLAGGTGLMLLMLERNRHIVTWNKKRWELIGLLFAEPVVFTSMSGGVGCLAGFLLSPFIGDIFANIAMKNNSWMPQIEYPAVFPPWFAVPAVLLLSALLGIVFELFPAFKTIKRAIR